MNLHNLNWLSDWYLSQCDGDWEHQFGIKIDTLDNPGWSIFVDLEGTQKEMAVFDSLYHNISEEKSLAGLDGDCDWFVCKVEDKQFRGYGGPRNLESMISVFKTWVESSNN